MFRVQSRSTRNYLLQLVVVVMCIVAVWAAFHSAKTNLATLGITSGFSFLDRSTGWGYSFSLLPRSIDDTYSKTLFIGFTNTLFLGLTSIFLSTIFGFIIGSARNSARLGFQVLSSIYVQIFRNIPLILQLVFLYSVFIHLPGPRQSHSVFDVVFLSNRGLMLPILNISAWLVLILVIASLVLAFFLFRSQLTKSKALISWIAATFAAFVVASFVATPAGEPALSVPALNGLRFKGGLEISLELAAMLIAIVLYGSAYIAEVVRGGLERVPRGQVEAGLALGLSQRDIWANIKMPMALRSIIPPLGNQWIFIMKATTIGVAIGFSDLFMLVSTSITQSGQTLELIALLMGAFLILNFTLAQFINWLNAHFALKAH